MGIRSGAAILGGVVLLSAASLAPAHAQLTTFGTESNARGAAAGAFTYTDTASSTGAIASNVNTGVFSIASGSAITFDFKVNNSASGNPEFVAANATFSATAVGAAVLNSDGSYSQAVSSITGNFAATGGVVGGNGGNTVLNFAFASGTFNFTAGSGTATFSASASEVAGPPGLKDFSSSFIDFSDPNAQGNYYQSEQFSLAISGINNTVGGTQGPTVAANNTIQSFAGDQTGTFSSNPVPISGFTNYPTASAMPEPSALALTLLGGIGFFPVMKRKRTKA